MRPDVEALASFVQVVDSGGITAAAARLGVAKSVVSKRVAELEAQLSTRLLVRAARGVTPTEAGTLLCQRARALLAQLDTVADEVMARSGALQGLIRMAAPLGFGTRHLGPALTAFMCDYPAIEVALDLDDRHVDLLGGGYDLALRIGRLGDSALRSRRLGLSRRALCCAPAYAARHGLPRTLEALHDHSCLGYANTSAGHLWSFVPEGVPETVAEPRPLVLRGRLTANSGEALAEAAAAGIGLVVLPRFLVAEAVASGRLREVRIPGWAPAPDTIHLVWPPHGSLPLKIRSLIDHLAARIREPFPWDAPFAPPPG